MIGIFDNDEVYSCTQHHNNTNWVNWKRIYEIKSLYVLYNMTQIFIYVLIQTFFLCFVSIDDISVEIHNDEIIVSTLPNW